MNGIKCSAQAIMFQQTTKLLTRTVKKKLADSGFPAHLIRCSRSSSSSHNKSQIHNLAQSLVDSEGSQTEGKCLEQVAVPDLVFEESGHEFRGLETSFPCLMKHAKAERDPVYQNVVSGYKLFHCQKPFKVRYNNGVLPELRVAYETWGELNEAKDNVVIISTGLSGNSHARSHPDNVKPGWWEKFIGPGCAIDTNRFFVICYNNLGGCHGSSGPSSINPLTSKPYATTFPIFSIEDMVKAMFMLLDHLGVHKVYANVGSSLGGSLSVTSAVMAPERIGRAISISSCLKSYPYSVALRYLQRKAIMLDPNWQKGYYYSTGKFPRTGVKLAREIATLTYRGGDEWKTRFGRERIDENEPPSLCPYYMIENYLDYQGESAVGKLDPNTMLYISKAMDLFDLGETFGGMNAALKRVTCPVMVMGVQSDILFPVQQQREMAQLLKEAGNEQVTYYELNSPYGHDTFLLDLNDVGAGIKGFLETEMVEKVRAIPKKNTQRK